MVKSVSCGEFQTEEISHGNLSFSIITNNDIICNYFCGVFFRYLPLYGFFRHNPKVKTESVVVLAIHGYTELVLLERNKSWRNSDSLQSYIMNVTHKL